MRVHQLRRILQQVVLAGIPVAASGCLVDPLIDVATDGDCTEQVARVIPIDTPADPPLQLKIDSCRVDVDACQALCQMAMDRAQLFATAEACQVGFLGDSVNVRVEYTIFNGGSGCPVDGRRPEGLAAPRRLDATSPAGAWLAQAAWLEAASVYAFVHLARELELHQAPRGLVRWALIAARDEVRHTELVTRLALRYGARPPVAEVALPAPRAIEQLAIENAAEGCVRETWGACIALWQSHTARDPMARAAFAEIAADEIRHAALAWAVDAWARTQLSPEAIARVDAAREVAARELFDDHAPESLAVLGLPQDHDARALVARAYESLWTPGGAS